ncbi:LysE family translocator [Pseudorhodoplanes sp.]|uniref:LysE family translocator n=1 Tax=Pseudorhodoplanes sp. TaxID=1934341 RepID=UPI00391932FE
MSLELLAAYLLACIVFTLVPGPTVTLIVANSLTHGTRAGLANVAGTQAGLAVFVAVLVIGLASVIETMGHWFDWVRFLGAAYLIWIGIRMWRSSGKLDEPGQTPKPRGGFFLQGFLVMLSNPKVLVFFGAFIPQFVDPSGNYVAQVIVLGAIAMLTAAVTDAAYAVLTGRARGMFTQARVRLVSKLSGAFLIGGGVWLALTRTR